MREKEVCLVVLFILVLIKEDSCSKQPKKSKKPGILLFDTSNSAESRSATAMSKNNKEECSSLPKDSKLIDNIRNTPLLTLLEKTESDLPKYYGHAVLVFGSQDSDKKIVAHTIAAGSLKELKVFKGKHKEKKARLKYEDEKIKTTSQTLAPRLIVSIKDKDIVFLNMADFKEKIPDAKADITEKYLLKTATSRLESFSILLVVSESTFDEGEKSSFGNVVRKIAEIIGDTETLEGGVGLVVTNVKNKDADKNKRKDEDILSKITASLKSFLEKTDQSDDQGVSKKMVTLTKMILEGKKIGLLRDPDNCGKFSKSTHAKQNRADLTKLVQSLAKIPNKPENVFTVKVNKVKDAAELIEEANQNLEDQIPKLVTTLVQKLKEEQERILSYVIGEFKAIKNWVTSDVDTFSSLENDLKDTEKSSTSNVEVLEKVLLSALLKRGYDVNLAKQFQTKIRGLKTQMEFFSEALGEKENLQDMKIKSWIAPFKAWVDNELHPKLELYDFLDELRKVVWGAEFQAKRGGEMDIPTTLAGVRKFIGEKASERIITDGVEGMLKKDELGRAIMREILTEAVENPKVECDGADMKITGSIIKVPPPSIRLSRGYYKYATTEALTCDDGHFPSRVIIHATRMVVWVKTPGIAQTPEYPAKELGVVAPTILPAVGNQVSVNLHGEPGLNGWDKARYTEGRSYGALSHGETKQKGNTKHGNSTRRGLKNKKHHHRVKRSSEFCEEGGQGEAGTDGIPGDHGLPGGYFIGMFLFKNPQEMGELRVDVTGGKGGDGSHGTDGHDGGTGRDKGGIGYPPTGTPDFSSCGKGSTCDRGKSKVPAYFHKCVKDRNGEPFKAPSTICYKDGCGGGEGGRGGDGGAGGQGGWPGTAFVLSNNAVNVKARSGEGGMGGEPGRGGQGGRSNSANAVWRWKERWGVGFLGQPGQWERVSEKGYGTKQNGRSGQAGANTKGQGLSSTRPQFALTPFYVYNGYVETVLARSPTHFPREADIMLEVIENSLDKIFPEGMTPILTFGQQLMTLERAHLKLRMDGKQTRMQISQKLIPRYENLKKKLDKYIEGIPGGGRLSNEEKKLVSIIYSMTMQQITVLRQVKGVPVVTDIDAYLELLNRRLDKYESMEQMEMKQDQERQRALMIQGERVRYLDTLYSKIDEALKYINEVVVGEVNKVEAEMNAGAKDLEAAVMQWIHQTRVDERAFKIASYKAVGNAIVHGVFGIFSMGASALSLFGGPYGAVAGAVVGGASSVGEGLLVQQISGLPQPKPLPNSIRRYGEQMERMSKKMLNNEQMEKTFTAALEQCARLAAKEIVGYIQEALGMEYKVWDEDCDLLDIGLKERMKLQGKGQEALEKMLGINVKLTQASKTITGTLGKLSGAVAALPGISKTEYGPAAIKAVKTSRDIMDIASQGLGVISKVLGDFKDVLRLRQMADKMRDERNALKKFPAAIHGIMVPFTQKILDGLRLDAAEGMTNSSRALLRVQKWEVQKGLKGYLDFLNDFTQGFPWITARFGDCVKSLQDAVALMVDLYDDIQKYSEHGAFADYIANLASITTSSFDKPKTKEGILFWQIEKALLGSMIYSEWETLQQNFQQWIFPFSREFQGILNPRPVKDYMSEDVKDSSGVIRLLIPDIKRWISDLRQQIGVYKSTTFPAIDNVLQETHFNSRRSGSSPFYVWRNEDHNDLIRKVLSGDAVTVSIDPGVGSKQAVKFRVVEIEMRARNDKVQKKLTEMLKKLRVELTHSGISRYYYDGEIFEMRGEKQFISYSFETNDDGKRLTTNAIYKKLKEGGIILSPYSVWTIQFLEVNSDDPVDWEELAKFSHLVDMELVGAGTYVTKASGSLSAQGRKVSPNVKEGRKINGRKLQRSSSSSYPMLFYSFRKSGWPVAADAPVTQARIFAKAQSTKKVMSRLNKTKKNMCQKPKHGKCPKPKFLSKG